MKKKPLAPTHGGARKGAGRPPGEIQSASRSIRLPVTDWHYLDSTGNASKAVREAVGMHRRRADIDVDFDRMELAAYRKKAQRKK